MLLHQAWTETYSSLNYMKSEEWYRNIRNLTLLVKDPRTFAVLFEDFDFLARCVENHFPGFLGLEY